MSERGAMTAGGGDDAPDDGDLWSIVAAARWFAERGVDLVALAEAAAGGAPLEAPVTAFRRFAAHAVGGPEAMLALDAVARCERAEAYLERAAVVGVGAWPVSPALEAAAAVEAARTSSATDEELGLGGLQGRRRR